MKTSKLRENANEKVGIVLRFASDWLREWREFFWINHRAKLTKTKAIPGCSRYLIENCSYLCNGYIIFALNRCINHSLSNLNPSI